MKLLILFAILSFSIVSSLYASPTCYEHVRSLLIANSKEDGTIQLGASSLGNHIPDFEKFRNRLYEVRPSVSKYLKNYYEAYGNYPSIDQILNYHIKASNNMSNYIRRHMGYNNELDYYLEIAARSLDKGPKYLKRYEKIKKQYGELLLQEFVQGDESQKKMVKGFDFNGYKGVLGELDAIFKLEDVYAQGVFLHNMRSSHQNTKRVNEFLVNKIEKRFNEIDESDLPNLARLYPTIFKPEYLELPPDEILKRAKNYVESKEFDIVLKKDDVFVFVEIKNYKGGLTRKLLRKGHGNKSPLKQQQEMLDILKFLGIEDQFFPAFHSMQGIRREAKEILENMGIIVIGRVLN